MNYAIRMDRSSKRANKKFRIRKLMLAGYDKRFLEGGFCGNIQKYFAHSVIYRRDPFKYLY